MVSLFSTIAVISKANGAGGKDFDNTNSPILYSNQISRDLLRLVKTLRNYILHFSSATSNKFLNSDAGTASGPARLSGSA